MGRAWWYSSVIPDTWELDVQGWPGKKLKTYLKNKLKSEELGVWLKW
jgi:hypothetical protein